MKTGFEEVGFRPVGMALAIFMDQEAKDQLDVEKRTEKKSVLAKVDNTLKDAAGNPMIPIFKGDKAEKEDAEKEAIFIVAAISTTLAEMVDAPAVGDRIIVRASSGFHPLVVNGKEYGICPSHLVLAIVKA